MQNLFQPLPLVNPKILLFIFIIDLVFLAINFFIQIKFKLNNLASKNIKNSFHSLFYTCIISVLVLLFFWWQNLPLFNYYLWWFLLAIIVIIWLLNILRYRIFIYKKDYIKDLKNQQFIKYLP
ncbi:MAG: hypothetical protein CEN91_275 [Candidatus Berkelbacteria bacterium Licking1014_85]|uniref:Uncharacterized protein n=1 Tax=Candidatus Berkelbacteria bacterium Licking1014_85 TaxID=2017148 RepID=A0A554LK65_9BACT|nr:MAG: hypothetical protein CEN91_275 [Candidatus Berkelbacteria bacterium Licking1014_85]